MWRVVGLSLNNSWYCSPYCHCVSYLHHGVGLQNLQRQGSLGGSLEEAMQLVSWAAILAAGLLKKQFRWGQSEGLGGQKGARHPLGLAKLPAPICRGAAHSPQVGWALSSEECVFSRHLVHSRWQPQLPLPAVLAALPFPLLTPPLTLVSAFGVGETACKPPKLPVTVGESWGSDCGSYQKRGNLEPLFACQSEKLCLSLFPACSLGLFG